jgi:GT2 family glycosyltransferase
MTRLSVVIPSWNTRELLRGCVCSLESALPHSNEVIVVDNASHDGSARMVATEFPHVRLLRTPQNEGFARAVNLGMERTKGEYVLVLQPDAELQSTSLRPLLDFLDANERYGAIVPRILNPDGSVQETIGGLPRLATPLCDALRRWNPDGPELRRAEGRGFDYTQDADVELASAVCMLLRRKALRRTQPFDEALWMFFTEADLCRRLAANNWRVRYTTQVQVFHHGARSVAQLADPVSVWHKDRVAYYRKHHGRLGADWVKLCASLAFADQLVLELWRRAHGLDEIPLRPAYETLAGCLRS